MNKLAQVFLIPLVILIATTPGGSTPQSQPVPPPPLASSVDREISAVEKLVLDAADAMPEEQFSFSPESLKISGSDYKDVRSFATEVKHIASSNYFLWSPLTGDPVPSSIRDGNGRADINGKAYPEIPPPILRAWPQRRRHPYA